jgi:hypothetical protein
MAKDTRIIEIEDGNEFLAGLNVDEATKHDFLSQLDEQVKSHIAELNRKHAKTLAKVAASRDMKIKK